MAATANFSHQAFVGQPIMSFQPRVLVLSGGGFRATLFHLGVVYYLKTQGLLRGITDIYSVSGGTILAAHLVLNWSKYTAEGDELFADASDKLVRFCQSDLRGRIVRRSLLYYAAILWMAIVPSSVFAILSDTLYDPWIISAWLALVSVLYLISKRRAVLSTLLQHEYDRFYAAPGSKTARTLHDFKGSGVPRIHLLTTNLTSGDLGVFTQDGLYFLHGSEPQRPFADTHLRVSLAVAASSAFPPVFSPVEFSRRLVVGESVARLPFPQFLTDGGVFDNLGIHAARLKRDLNDSILVSSAERQFDVDLNDGFRTLPKRSWRTSDILMTRVGTLEQAIGKSDKVRYAELSQDEIGDFLPARVQKFVRNIRTDLDDFSATEVQLLCYRGYGAAMLAVEEVCRKPPEIEFIQDTVPTSSDKFWLPVQGAHPRFDIPLDEAQLERSSSVRLKLWKTGDIVSYACWATLLSAILFSYPVIRAYLSIPHLPSKMATALKPIDLGEFTNDDHWTRFTQLSNEGASVPNSQFRLFLVDGQYGRNTPRFTLHVRMKGPADLKISKILAFNTHIASTGEAYISRIYNPYDSERSATFYFPKSRAGDSPVILVVIESETSELNEIKNNYKDLFELEVTHNDPK